MTEPQPRRPPVAAPAVGHPNGRVLSDADVEAVARRVVELQREAPPVAPSGPLVDALAVAEALGRSRGWVYAHADELGALRIGSGLRFDLARVLASRPDGESPNPPESPRPSGEPGRRRRGRSGTGARTTPSGAPLLPIKGARDADE